MRFVRRLVFAPGADAPRIAWGFFMRRILHYSPGPEDFQAAIDDRAIVGCWFELYRQGGCGAGELRLRDEFPARSAIGIGDWIACEVAEGDRWYLGRVERRVARSPALVTLSLQGMSAELGEVFPGGFGRSVADNTPPHLFARLDLFAYDPDRADETFDSVNRADDVVRLLLEQYVAPRTHIIYDAALIDDAADDSVTSLKFRGEETARAIVLEQALRAGNAAWGVGADGKFFFLQQPETVLATYREGADLLALEETRGLEGIFNRVLLTGDYVYNAPLATSTEFGGFYRWRGNYIQPASRDTYGERRIRMNVPWIRDRRDARRFLEEFFRVYAQPSQRYVIEVGNQTTLPRPWEGTVTIQDREGSELITAAVETIRVEFDHAPRFRMTIGPADPRVIWPEPPHDERWELAGVPHGDVFTDSESSSSSVSSSESSSSASSSTSDSSSEAAVDCCPEPLPATLIATVVGTEGCECFGTNVIELSYDEGDAKWKGSLEIGEGECGPLDLQLEFYCQTPEYGCGGFWCQLSAGSECSVGATPAICDCDPLQLIFILRDDDCCEGPWLITISAP